MFSVVFRRLSFLLFSAVVFLCLFCSCPLDAQAQEDGKIIICSWNVQNLFDGTDNGNEYDEFKTASGWDDKQYRIRLAKLETALGYGMLGKADVIVLNEVENENVVEDVLNLSSFRRRGFEYYVCAGEEGGAIRTAVISRYPFSSAFVHGAEGMRPVLEVNFTFSSKRVCLLAVHAKSNLGDEEENIGLRSLLGEIIENLASSVSQDDGSVIVAAAGDFNENPQSGHVLKDPDRWYVFWDDGTLSLDAGGSYRYDGTWFEYDNIALFNDCLSSLSSVEGGVECSGILSTVYGYPDSFSKSLQRGVSDHFPVWISISLP